MGITQLYHLQRVTSLPGWFPKIGGVSRAYGTTSPVTMTWQTIAYTTIKTSISTCYDMLFPIYYWVLTFAGFRCRYHSRYIQSFGLSVGYLWWVSPGRYREFLHPRFFCRSFNHPSILVEQHEMHAWGWQTPPLIALLVRTQCCLSKDVILMIAIKWWYQRGSLSVTMASLC